MYKCCIFDLDGTLANSIYAIQKAVNDTLAHFDLGPVSVEDTKVYVGDGYRVLMERALKACGDKELIHYQESLELYEAIFKECSMYRLEVYDGIRELLAFFKENGIRIAVLSNKPHARTLENVEGLFGPGYFDGVYGEREKEGIKKKPAPDGVWDIVNEFGLKREECLYMGDTNTDMETGRNAGLSTIGAAWGFRPREELEAYHPVLVADHPSQVTAWVKEVNGIEG